MEHIIPLLQHMLVFLGLAYLFTKTPAFTALINHSLSPWNKIFIWLIFSIVCILGTFLSEQSLQSDDAIVNTRAIGAILGGLLGGPLVGFFVGLSGGIHRIWSMSSPIDPITYIDIACAVSTTLEGLVAGCVHHYFSRKGKIETLFSPYCIFGVALIEGIGHVVILLLFGWLSGKGMATWNLQGEIALPMLIANPTGVVLIMYMISQQKQTCDAINSDLLKPVKKDSLNTTLTLLKKISHEIQYVPCYRENRTQRLPIKDVYHVFSLPETGTHLYRTGDKRPFHTSLSLKIFEDNSPLKRCHRQHLVNPEFIKSIEEIGNGLGIIHTTENTTIPISRKYMDDFPPFA